MALFRIARYEEPEKVTSTEDRAQVLLQRLQVQARERQLKKQKQQEAKAETRSPGDKTPGPPGPAKVTPSPPAPEEPTRKAKKRKWGDGSPPRLEKSESEPDPESSQKETCSPRKPKGKKKKKTGKKNSEAAADKSSEEQRKEKDSVGASEPSGEANEHPLILGVPAKQALPKVQPFLPKWLAEPSRVQKSVKDDLIPVEAIPGIHPCLQKKLKTNGILSYFPIQAAVIPALLESASHGFLVARGGYQPSDICVSAPTGSGKTLSFVIPVIQVLLERVVCHIRALVVLPTKELAQQVSKVFNVYADGTALRIAQITGQKSLAKEQEILIQKTDSGYCSLADIVVATPGRLVDHIDQTPGFSLRQLRFLIIDEADQMIDSMHQSWLPRVVKAVFHGDSAPGSSPLFQRLEPKAITAASTSQPQMPLQKLLFSATLTRNPEKLQELGLYQPRLFSTGLENQGATAQPGTEQDGEGKYTFPAGLSHFYVPCTLNSKPLVILHLMRNMKFSRVLCFTNSREHSHRLFLLVKAFGGVSVAEFSSRFGPGQRKTILKQFEQGKIQLLISTDATARGIDVKGVKLVINYDAPQYIRTYVHRVGRTARAGNPGLAFTLLLKVQEQKFLQMLREARAPELDRHLIRSEHLKALVPQYEEALSELQKTIRNEWRQKKA
ncbi:ATP-dependent RNA helicase DDX51 [Dromiciops gliroides]|uniref:ATP-dependent RNA helicase DDX51 n=1 Tax=Dromiciops gliroides TaxID=33562 RepID=UPI001CC3AAB2|nr:ATP-dependent RNA helicase DDX51 [Dromiciops gliroides]